ncbi:MAG: phosphate signaling complex protein PhoU [Myxococcales bacterium]|nr:phosphate signaling complex protein PhoU [Myxococcales bacterium]
MSVHTSKEFERELRTLRERLLAMGGRAEQQIQRAIDALRRRSDELADEVIRCDAAIDRDEVEIDELAFLVLARRQPVASDLRFVMTALKIVTDVERIGDLAVNIAKRVRELNRHPTEEVYGLMEQLAALVMAALRGALDAFVHGDADAAERVIAGDPEIDVLNTDVIRAALGAASREAHEVGRWLALSSISRYLERIGDHSTNIAEMVIYSVRGRDVRHHHGGEQE